MESTELVKNFERIRDYMRQFYVYGFKSRSEIGIKSPRSYDNERRRIESWLGDYMSFRREDSGKQVFLSLDSRCLEHNPLYNAFKAKSFTDKDITLHFYILDILSMGSERTVAQMAEEMDECYLSHFPNAELLDVSTLRKKLKEYEKLGLVISKKRGKELYYSLPEDRCSPERWQDALDFYSEASPLGVIGSFLLDRLPDHKNPFRFKHHYLLHTLDSQILFQLLDAISQAKWVTLTTLGKKNREQKVFDVLPYRIFISCQTGRQYLLACHRGTWQFRFFRMDLIHAVKPGITEEHFDQFLQKAETFSQKVWGVSVRNLDPLDHLEMTIWADTQESFILQRLLREKRSGHVEILDSNTYRFSADVSDALEMLPWIRTFTGRILSLECSNPQVTARFYDDLNRMCTLYGGDV